MHVNCRDSLSRPLLDETVRELQVWLCDDYRVVVMRRLLALVLLIPLDLAPWSQLVTLHERVLVDQA